MDDLRRARLERDKPTLRARLGDWLAMVGGHIAADDLGVTFHRGTRDEVHYDADGVRGAVLVVIAADGPVVLVNGELDHDDLTAASNAVGDYRTGGMAAVTAGFASRAEFADRRVAHAAATAAESPWLCEFCERRYKTERGAVRHESNCTGNPDAHRYTTGEYVATSIRDGRVTGWRRVIDGSGPPDPVAVADRTERAAAIAGQNR
jgi:hypothetical protein